MKRRTWAWVGGGILVVAAVPFTLSKIEAHKDEAAFQEQLRLARAEGIPTNWKEFAATIPTTRPSENAAPIYRELMPPDWHSGKPSKSSSQKPYPSDVDLQLRFHPNTAVRSDAMAVLLAHQRELVAVDRAVALPKCWFDRDWSLGVAVLMPEYAYMKQATKVVALRGSVAADHGDVAEAIANAQKVFQVAKHAGFEHVPIGQLVESSIYGIGLGHLESWAFSHPDQPAYQRAIRDAIREEPRLSLKQSRRDELCSIFSVIEDSETPEGLKRLGLAPGTSSKLENVMPFFLSRSKAKIALVKAHRELWAALDQPRGVRSDLVRKAESDRMKAFIAWPTAADVYSQLTEGLNEDTDLQESWEARRQQHTALLRALEAKTPHSIKTSDLLSPFDGKPLRYTFNGKQMVFEVSGFTKEGKPVLLKMPPDPTPKR